MNLSLLPTLLSLDRQCNLVMYSRRAAAEHPQAALAEFGVYKGGSLELLAKTNPDRPIYGIDSFEGLPEPSEHDFHTQGEFNDVDHMGIVGYFRLIHPNVRILKGKSPKVFEFFDNTVKFSFVHIDVDLYRSVMDACEFFYRRMVKGGIMLFDDYCFTSTPGTKKALDRYFGHNEIPKRTEVMYADGYSHKQYIVFAP